MSLKITSVTYRRYRGRTILATGLFSRVKTAKNAGGLHETLCPEMAFASAGGRLLAG
jgi:ubiquinone biosynthesis protein COQ9